ncbi:MAG TPA: class I SAM-dependent methyltransferase [Myxococcales bacterium]|jgi:SAM-dependent methyltransferase
MRDVPFFGELYRRTTEPLLAPEVTQAEGRYLREQLGLSSGARLLDLGCGSGRHLSELASTGARLAGVDIDLSALRAARCFAQAVAGDLRSLPFRTACFDAAVCWYTTLFVFDEAGNRQALSEVARVLAPGGRLVFQTVNPARLAEQPTCSFEQRLPDGSLVRETSTFDPLAGVDEGTRLLELPDGQILRGRYRLRYYRPEELARLFESCGLRIVQVHGSVQGDAYGAEARDLIAWSVRV